MVFQWCGHAFLDRTCRKSVLQKMRCPRAMSQELYSHSISPNTIWRKPLNDYTHLEYLVLSVSM